MSVTTRRKYISVSQLTDYMTCPAHWAFRQVEKLPAWRGEALVRGSAFHASIRQTMEQRMKTGEHMDFRALRDLYAAELDRELEGGEMRWDQGGNRDAAIDQDWTGLTTYLEGPGRDVSPAALEQRFEIDFDNADWMLVGYIDIITEDGSIIDLKRHTGSCGKEGEADKSPQLTCYALGHEALRGFLPPSLALHHIGVGYKTKPQVRTKVQPTTRTEADIDRFLRTASAIVEAMNTGAVFPNESSFYCGAERCPYWGPCHERF